MPSKIQLDENLWFLYICLQKSDLKTVDFAAVGAVTNLKPPAARMRYTRLRRQIESGTLIRTHGTPFTGAPDKIARAGKKRKRGSSSTKNDNDDGEEDDAVQPKVEKEGGGKRNTVVKEEKRDSWSEFESSGESDGDSEDEIPLAKLRKAKMASNAVIQSVPYGVPGLMFRGNGVSRMMPPYQQVVAHPTYGFGHCTRGNGNQRLMQGEYYPGGSKPTQSA